MTMKQLRDLEDLQIRITSKLDRVMKWKSINVIQTELALKFMKAIPAMTDGKSPAIKKWLKAFIMKQKSETKCMFCGAAILKNATEESKQCVPSSLIPISLGGKNVTENYVVSCSKCHEELGERDWILYGKAKDQETYKVLYEQREEVLMRSDNHVITFDFCKDFRLVKNKLLIYMKERWEQPRMVVYANVFYGGGLLAYDKRKIDTKQEIVLKGLLKKYEAVKSVGHPFLETSVLHRDSWYGITKELIKANAILKRVDVAVEHPTYINRNLPEDDRRWYVLLTAREWIDDVYHHLRETKLLRDYQKWSEYENNEK